MCRVQIYTKQCTTCQTVFKDEYNRNKVHVERHPCPYVIHNRLRFGDCGQRTRQERCGRMDFGECDACIDDMLMNWGEKRRRRHDYGGGGGGGGGSDTTPRGSSSRKYGGGGGEGGAQGGSAKGSGGQSIITGK